MRFDQSNALRSRAHNLIPGGGHAYAKGDDQFPELSPGFIVRGNGSHVWDVDGNDYIEYGQGNRTVALGHAFPDVVRAVENELGKGSNFIRPSVLELQAAEALLQVVPRSDMVKFCKDGSDATTAAVKLARAVTGRDMVACCRDQPLFATNDWFIGTTPVNAGVPRSVQELTVTFGYNDLASLEEQFLRFPGKIACVILEPSKYEDPQDGFLHRVKSLCHSHGALFILDEMITGFRWHIGGGQAYYDVEPDLACWGKALGNGFSVSALTGKREYMERGGLHHPFERVFLLSTTHGAETHALAASIATLRVYQEQPVIETLYRLGERLLREGSEVIGRHGLTPYLQIYGKPCCLTYATRNASLQPCFKFRTLFLQETIRRGILMTSLVVGYSHTDADIDVTLEAIDGACKVYARALEEGVEKYMVGRPIRPVFRRYNDNDTAFSH